MKKGIVYRVFVSSYDDCYTDGVFGNESAAIEYARALAREVNEEFTGSIGYGVGIEWLDPNVNDHGDVTGWPDWRVKISGARFVIDEGG